MNVNILAESNIHDSISHTADFLSVFVNFLCAIGGGMAIWGAKKVYNKVDSKRMGEKSKEIFLSIKKNRYIQNAVKDAREILGADRLLIFLYHNGEIFAGGLHYTKITCYFESLQKGVTSMSRDFIGTPSTLFDNWYLGNVDNPSIIHLDDKNNISDEFPLLFEILVENGVKSRYSLPLLSKNGDVIGEMITHYLKDTKLSDDKMEMLKNKSERISELIVDTKLEDFNEQ